MKTTGLVFSSRDYIGSAEPPATVLEDESRFGNDFAFLGDGEPNWVQLPSGLWVLDFDGSDYATRAITASLKLVDNFAYKFWLKTNTDDKAIWNSYNATNQHDNMSFNIYDGYLRVTKHQVGHIITATTQCTDDIWHQWIIVRDNAPNWYIYMDGVEEVTNSDVYNPTVWATQYLGYGPYGYYDGMMGLIDIWNYAPSPEQIAAIFQNERHWFGV